MRGDPIRQDSPEALPRHLPPIGGKPHLVHVLKNHGKWLTFALANQQTGEVSPVVFTMHRAEGKKLAELILKMISEDSEAAATFVEGGYLGGPPRKQDLVEPQK